MENKAGKKKEKRKYSVPAVENAFKILNLLSLKEYYKSNLSEIAKALSLTPTTCYRILQQLEELLVVRYDESSKRYSLGPYMAILGDRAKENLFDVSIIIPYLENLSEKTGLTSLLVNRVGKTRSTFIAKVEGQDFGINAIVGKYFSVVDGSYGKCFLAHMDEAEAEELLRMNNGRRKLSEQDIQEIMNELPIIREKGYATTFGEYVKGICGIAAPIYSVGANVEMVIALLGLTAQYDEHGLLEEEGKMLRKVADEISLKLSGYYR